MNVTLLHRIADYALAHPQRVSTDKYIVGTLEQLRDGTHGAAGDIAGLALALTPGADARLSGRGCDDYVGSAAIVLELPLERAHRLFAVGFWPEDLRERLEKAWPGREEAEVVAERVRRFIGADAQKVSE